MAEKIIIAEVDIDMEAAIADQIDLKKRIQEAMKAVKEAKESQGELSSEYIQASATLKGLQADLKTNENIINKLTVANDENRGSVSRLEAANSALRAEQKKLNLETDEGVKRNKEIVDQINANTEAIKQNSDTQKKGWMSVGQYTESIKDALGDLIPGFNKATGAAKMFGVGLNLALLPISAIVIAIVSLITYFKRTEEGSNKLNKIMAVLGAVFNQVMEVVGKLGEAIFKAFENPKEAIQNLWKLIKENIMNRLTGLVDTFKAFGKILKGVFTLDWGAVKKGASEFGESFIQTMTGVDDAIGKVKRSLKGFMDEAAKEAAQAAKIADMKAALRKRERAEIVNDEKDLMKIANLREEAAKKDKYNGEQRLKLIDQAAAIEKAMMKDDIDIARQKAFIHKEEMKMKGESTEALDEQARLEAEIFRIQKENSEKIRGLEKARQTAINDILEDKRKEAEESVRLMEVELEKWNIMNREKISTSEVLTKDLIENENKRLNDQIQKETEIFKAQLDNKLITQGEYDLKLIELEANKNSAISELNYQFEQEEKARKLEAAQIDFDNTQALFEENVLSQLDAQRAANERMLAEEIKAAEKVGADVSLIKKKYSKADIALNKAERDAKLSLAKDFATNIATIAGENTKVGKAAAVAATTINTYQAATGAYAALAPIPYVGPVLGIAAAAAAVAAGIANVRKILAVQPGSTPSGGSESSGSVSSSAPVSSLQSANTEIGQGLVSRATQTTNQTTISNSPVLVVDKVTDAQMVEKQKVEAATI